VWHGVLLVALLLPLLLLWLLLCVLGAAVHRLHICIAGL
jgi:hypothetical protein